MEIVGIDSDEQVLALTIIPIFICFTRLMFFIFYNPRSLREFLISVIFRVAAHVSTSGCYFSCCGCCSSLG